MNYKKTAFLMGTNIEIIISSEKNPIQDIYESFWLIYSYELEFSRFLPQSDLSQLNQLKTLEVSERFIKILRLSKEIFQNTSGYFNPLINLSRIGYSQNFENYNFSVVDSGVNLDLQTVKIEGNTLSLENDQNIDFGWIVKWYVVDRVRDFLFSKWYKNFIVNAGWDIYAAGDNNGVKWVVWIDNPFIPNEVFATLELENKSISTSWSYKRNWKIKNKEYHHIVNPLNNNRCESEMISLTLIAPDTLTTDTLATACFNMWIEKSLTFLEKSNIDSLIVGSDKKIYVSSWLAHYNFNPL